METPLPVGALGIGIEWTPLKARVCDKSIVRWRERYGSRMEAVRQRCVWVRVHAEVPYLSLSTSTPATSMLISSARVPKFRPVISHAPPRVGTRVVECTFGLAQPAHTRTGSG